jgi:hypothetical protein
MADALCHALLCGPQNRRLHVAGTTVVIALLAYNPVTALSVVTTGCVGYVLCALLAGLATGFVEFGVMLATLLVSHYVYTGSFRYALLIPIVGYSFAWVGHFYCTFASPPLPSCLPPRPAPRPATRCPLPLTRWLWCAACSREEPARLFHLPHVLADG